MNLLSLDSPGIDLRACFPITQRAIVDRLFIECQPGMSSTPPKAL